MNAPRFRTADSIPVYLEESRALPLVDIDVLIARGALLDPRGAEGLARMTLRLMRRGPADLDAEAFDEELDALGATLGATVSNEMVRFHGSVIRRNLRPFLRRLTDVLLRPALREVDFERLRRQALAELVQLRDHDSALASRAFRRELFGRHSYGRSVSGDLESIASLDLEAVREMHAKLIRAPHMIVGLAGDLDETEAREALDETFVEVPRGATRRPRARDPKMRGGRHIVVVDKPERTQTQLYIGTLGLRLGDPTRDSMSIANTAFGGTFTARLMKEVRSERGWSYGAYSKLGAARQREAWSMWTHPGADQLLDCLALQLHLYERWLERGLTAPEVRQAKRYLSKSHAFELETASKRLEPRLQIAAHGLPDDWWSGYPKRIRASRRRDVNEAVGATLSRDDLAIAMVATATPELLRGLRDLPGVRSVTRIPFTEV